MFGKKQSSPKEETVQNTDSTESILRQDLSEKASHSGVYMMWLLFREKVPMPSAATLLEKLQTRFGAVDIVSGKGGIASFALTNHPVTYADGQQVPSQVMLTECTPVKEPLGDTIARTQFWDCPNGVELLDSCHWQVMASDFLARGLPPLERADILADWLEIVLELFPHCVAVYFAPSGKLLTPESVRENPYSGPLRFFHGGVNVRFFNIQGTTDMLVDSLGMYALGLPDVQYHFHGLDPNEVVLHAYNTALYQFENDAPIESGHTIGGIEPESKWRCRYERALIQPDRDVLDIAAGECASGNRE